MMLPCHSAGLRGSNHLLLQLSLICLQGRSAIEGMYHQSFVGFIHQAGEVAGSPGQRSRAHRRQGRLCLRLDATPCPPFPLSPALSCCARKQQTCPLTPWASSCCSRSVLYLLGVQATGSWADQPCFYTCSSSPNPVQIGRICLLRQSATEHFKGESATARALMRRLSLKQLGHVSGQNTSQTFGEYTNYQSYSHRGILAPVFSSLLQWGC